MSNLPPPSLPLIGWREWVTLPDIGITAVKAKVDTGARSSALHAFDVEGFSRDGKEMVRFKVHPFQRKLEPTVSGEGELLCMRQVRNSGGQETLRPVILTTIELAGQRSQVEVTLTSRDAMGFRMLLGRQALRRRFLVDPNRSYLAGKRPRRKKKTKKKRAAE